MLGSFQKDRLRGLQFLGQTLGLGRQGSDLDGALDSLSGHAKFAGGLVDAAGFAASAFRVSVGI